MKKVLVVEDEADIRELLENFLQDAGYAVTPAADGVEALSLFRGTRFDLVLLDIMLPKIDGYGVLELIRRESPVPVLLLTALDGEAEQLRGYDLLADDYITKPFSMQVLLRKIAAVLRRSGKPGRSNLLEYKSLRLDPEGFSVSVGNRAVDLTRREFELLRELLTNRGRVLTRQNLLDRVWGYDYYGEERVVDTHVKNLRKKLGMNCINTVRGVGYRVDKEDPREPHG